MSDEEDYNSEEDLDYVPTDGEQVSEEENSGEEEDLSLLNDEENQNNKQTGKRKKTVKKKNAIAPRRRQGGIKLDEKGANSTSEQLNSTEAEDEEEKTRRKELAEEIAKEEEAKKQEKEKKRADDLWSSFMSDVKSVPSRRPGSGSGLGGLNTQVTPTKQEAVKVQPTETEKGGKVTITKVFDFAGEEVKIVKEVDANSKEAKAEQKKQEKTQEQGQEQKESTTVCTSTPEEQPAGLGVKRPAVGGLGSVLSKIKKHKMGTLEKSKIDWEVFKKKEGIDQDLKIHNKGKQGYTERMAFLNRTDQRQYEIERDLRLGSNSKR